MILEEEDPWHLLEQLDKNAFRQGHAVQVGGYNVLWRIADSTSTTQQEERGRYSQRHEVFPGSVSTPK